MPPWEKSEMEESSQALGKQFNNELFNKWGGVFVDTVRGNSLEDTLTDLLSSKELQMILSVLDCDSLSPPIQQNQWILHRYPTDDYKKFEVRLPSKFIEDKVLEVLDRVPFYSLSESNCVYPWKVLRMESFSKLADSG